MKSVAVLPLFLALLATGCGNAEPKVVPKLTGLDLAAAEARLDARGLDHSVVGGGTFGVILRSRWQVCEQVPRAGRRATEVTLVVERACARLPARRSTVVPDVEYQPLDEAEEELEHAGLGFDVEGDDEIVVRANWDVCDQDPAPGEWGAVVELYVAHDCWDW